MDYPEALYPDRFYVLGRRMAHFTLGHALLLARVRSPFAVPQETLPTVGDVTLALALCRRAYPKAERYIGLFYGGRLRKRLAYWRLWLDLCPPRRTIEVTFQLQHYLMRSTEGGPTCWQQHGRELGTPFLLAVKLTLVMHCHRTEAEALGMPFCAALWEYSCVWELLERKQLVSDADRQMFALAKEMAVNGR